MHQHGGDIYTHKNSIDFSANINVLGMPDSVREAAITGVLQSGAYPDVKCRELKRAIASRDGIKAEWIFCGNGAADVIFTLVRALKPKRALIPIPSFFEYEQALGSVDCEIDKYTCVPAFGFALREDFLDRITESTDMIFLCNPNNPTGTLLEPELLERIIERCEQTRTYLVLDECFVDFLDDWQKRTQVGKLGTFRYLIIIKAFTKMYAMAGLRLGYGITTDTELLHSMEEVSQPWRVSVPAMLAGTAAVKETDFAEYTRGCVAKERIFLTKELKKAGYQVFEPAANFIFFRAETGLAEYCLKRGFLIRDCGNYDGLSDGYYRIAVKSREDNEKLLTVLRNFKMGFGQA